MSYAYGEGVMSTTLTIRLDDDLARMLERVAKETRRTKSEVARDMLRRQAALQALRSARARIVPLAEKAGYFTDEDVFRDFS